MAVPKCLDFGMSRYGSRPRHCGTLNALSDWTRKFVTKITHRMGLERRNAENAFTLVEVVMASGLAGIVFISAMAAFSSAFSTLQLDRENSRATQILLEKTEMLRLYNWD